MFMFIENVFMRDIFFLFWILECDLNMFGKNCRSNCGYCVNNEMCNYIDGKCINGCVNGFYWLKCNIGFNI